MWSRNERPLLRYFPELRPLGELLPPRSALDGEIVIARDGALDFDAMQMRLHPAESRIRRLSAEIPAEFVVFDVLLWDGEAVWKLPLEERRARVEALDGFRLSPATRDVDEARGWLERFEALGLDGVIAKKLGVPYLPGSRDGVVKVKEHKTADCVVVGVRWKGDRSVDRDAPARAVPRGRRSRLRRHVRGRREDAGRGGGARAAAARRVVGAAVLRAEPVGLGRAGGGARAAGARRRGALRQGAGLALPPRHEADPLARGQGARPTARGASCDRRATRTRRRSRRSSAGPKRRAQILDRRAERARSRARG